ncbi:peptidoglycan recognition family protein [Luteimonas terricola]|uniref:peptidoglycan recognition family protein n=1 Tax=Luteimonas terricola TaxID=645597 RepID=UPI0014049AFC|nr:peptidoglycan recognition family protein [Luteimonas terricola]
MSTARLPLDPLHPDHEMYQRLLAGVAALDRWEPAQASNLAAALYADLRAKQPHMLASDLGRVLAGDPMAQRPSLFAAPRSGYHAHTSDPAILLFSTPITAADHPASQTLMPFGRHTTIDHTGYLTDPGITRTPISAISHAPMPQVNGVVLHRTESSTAASTLSTWRARDAGTGAHFLIDRDGTIHQTVSVNRQAWHVGAIRSRGEVEGTITMDDRRELDAARNGQAEWRGPAVRAVSRIESSRPYPERYPGNADSIGIEVVGRYHPATQRWDDPTPEQTAAINLLMESLQRNFGLTDEDVYEHDAISRKTPGEGAGLYVPAPPGLGPDAADAGRVPVAGPQR